MKVKSLLSHLIVCVVCITSAYAIVHYNNKKVAVVDAIKLFNGFNMKKELEQKSEGRLKYLGARLDSVKAVIEENQKQGVDNKELYVLYQNRQAEFESEFQQSNQLINEMVWKRLNPLIDEYGKQHKYRLIIGANGMGSVLYSNDYYDRTEELIKYTNSKYEGK